MKIGYARVSSDDQNLERQLIELSNAGVEKTFREKESGKNIIDRPAFIEMMEFAREGDILVFESFERMGRNYDEMKETIREIDNRGMQLVVLAMPNLGKPTGDPLVDKLIRNILVEVMSWVAQREREEILRKQKQGIAIAKSKGAYKGSKPQYSATSRDPQKRFIYRKIVEMIKEGRSVKKIAEETGTNRQLVYRIKQRDDL